MNTWKVSSPRSPENTLLLVCTFFCFDMKHLILIKTFWFFPILLPGSNHNFLLIFIFSHNSPKPHKRQHKSRNSFGGMFRLEKQSKGKWSKYMFIEIDLYFCWLKTLNLQPLSVTAFSLICAFVWQIFFPFSFCFQ